MATASRTFFLGGCLCCCTPRLLSPSSSSSSFFVNLPLSNALALKRRTLLLPIGVNNGDHHRPHLPPRPNTSSSSFYHSSSSLRCAQKILSTHLIHEPDCSPSRCPNVVEILEQRGLLESLTCDSLRSACFDPNLPPLRVYCGFDPTAESLHLGNLIGIIVLSWFLRCGHKAVALVGGATGRVGDPSGKSLERPELDPQTLERNTAAIAETVFRILGRNTINPSAADGSFVVLDNYDWWKDFKLLDFLKEVGRFARVGAMMSKESVKRRLESEQGMSYTEFSYQLLQGYDFLYLFEKEGVNVQIGGSDQWGNITAGTDLIRRILHADGAYGLTFPLLLKSDGTKFGKSEEGALWLSPSMLSPYKFYQHFFSVPDTDVVRFLKTLTFLSMEEIGELERKMQRPAEYVPNTAQRRLAEEVTRFVHGEEGLEEAVKATEALRPGAETRLNRETIERIAAGDDVPSCSLPYNQVLSLSIVDLSVSTGLLDTKSAARRLLKQGGLYLNNTRVDVETKRVEAQDIVDGKILLLSAGKKNKMVVRVN
ncbi:tyrosine--tRNA ligase [Sarracenia purpurea var. burkii]